VTDIEYNFVSEWPTDTDIDWWNQGRAQLNPIIKAYNQWQIDGFDTDEAVRLRAQIICGIQTFATRDGGGGWRDELQEMLRFVESREN
jgi:hypothetical protein